MLLAIARFELRLHLRALSTWIYFALFFAIAYLAAIAAGGAFSSVSVTADAGGKVLINAPSFLHSIIPTLCYLGLVIIGAIAGGAAHRDFRSGTYPLLFTKPVRTRDYLLGRYLGALAALVLVFTSVGLGTFIGTLMPFLTPELVGPNRFAAYLNPYLSGVFPNLVVAAALFFALAALTRKMLPVYATSVVLLVGYLIALGLTSKVEHRFTAAILDPFGLLAADHVTEYWTIAEKNTRLVPFVGALAWNRLLWLGVAAAVLGLTLRRFRFAHASGAEGASDAVEEPERPASALRLTQPASPPGDLEIWARLSWLALRETVKNVYFAVILLAGVLFMVAASRSLGAIYGTNTYPVTYQIIELVGGSFGLFVLIIITFYSGELAWHERDTGIADLMDATRLPGWVPFTSKLTALIGVQALLMLVVLVCGVLIQAFQGYFRFELGQYAAELFGLKLVQAALLCTLALTVQTLVNHKYTGYFVMVLYFLANSFAARFNFEHHLYRYATAPGHVYSDMNAFGPFLRSIVWFDAYWAAAACLLAGASCLLWVRGHETGPRTRLRLAVARLTRPVRLWLGGFALVLVGLGAFLYYNTNVLNRYRTGYDRREESASYERRYRRLKDVAQPRVTAIRLECDLIPEKRSLRARGVFDLRNKTGQPISTVYVDLSDELKLRRLALGGLPQPTEADEKLGFYTFTLPAPLPPGAGATLSFEVDYAPRGITNQPADTFVAENGTFFNSVLFPRLGYQEDRELEDDSDRRRHGLAPRERMPDVADLAARRNNLISNDADWIDLDLTISTVPDQIALAPGALVRSWDAGGRRYFQYRSERPVLRFFSVLSARYQVLRDRWRDVAIEIDYHPGHEYNLERMVASVKASLEYFTTHFSPFQYRQVRIIEFPRYATFAQSFPGSIPYSENIGFIAKVDPKDPDDVDYPFYVTAHEVAHQWWAHQVIGGRVQGVTFLDETLAQYSALMVMKHSFGDTQMKRFLRYELDRYLSGRGRERKKELPLYRVEDQPYVHYNKGSLVMYALQDYLGEDVVNRCLAAYIQKTAYQEPPYTNSIEFLALLQAATPPAERHLITDLFETITLYDLRATAAKYRKVGDKYEVTLTVSASKFRADEFGKETSIPVDERVDIGVQDGEGKFLYLAKHPLHGATASYTVTVEQPPAKVGVDPLNKLIDRKPDDNVIAVSATAP